MAEYSDNIEQLYRALEKKGYNDIGTQDEFRQYVTDSANVSELHKALSKAGYDDIGTEQEFSDWLGSVKKSEVKPAETPADSVPDTMPDTTGSVVNAPAVAPETISGSQEWRTNTVNQPGQNPYNGRTYGDIYDEVIRNYGQNIAKQGIDPYAEARAQIIQAGITDDLKPEDADKLALNIRHGYANRYADNVSKEMISTLPDQVPNIDDLVDGLWYTRDMQARVNHEAARLGLRKENYVNYYLKPHIAKALSDRYGYDTESAKHIAGRLLSQEEHTTDAIRRNEAAGVISEFAGQMIYDQYQKLQEAADKASRPTMLNLNGTKEQKFLAALENWQATDPEKVWQQLKPVFDQMGSWLGIVGNEELFDKISQMAEAEGIPTNAYIDQYVIPTYTNAVQKEFERIAVEREMPEDTYKYILMKMGESLVGNIGKWMIASDARRRAQGEALQRTDMGQGEYKPGYGARIAGGAAAMLPDIALPYGGPFGLTAAIANRPVAGMAQYFITNGWKPLFARMAQSSASGMASLGAFEGVKGAIQGAINPEGYEHLLAEDKRNAFEILGDMIKGGFEHAVPSAVMGATMVGGPLGQKISNGRGLLANMLGWGTQVGVDAAGATALSAIQNMPKIVKGDITVGDLGNEFLESVGTFAALGLHGKAKEFASLAEGGRSINGVSFSKSEVQTIEDIFGKPMRDVIEDIDKLQKSRSLITKSRLGITAETEKQERNDAIKDAATYLFGNIMKSYQVPADMKVRMCQAFNVPLPEYALKPKVLETFDEAIAKSVDAGWIDMMNYEFNRPGGVADKLKNEGPNSLRDYELTLRLLFQDNKRYNEIGAKLQAGEELTPDEIGLVNSYNKRLEAIQADYFKMEKERITAEFENAKGLKRGTIQKMIDDLKQGKGVSDPAMLNEFEEAMRVLSETLDEYKQKKEAAPTEENQATVAEAPKVNKAPVAEAPVTAETPVTDEVPTGDIPPVVIPEETVTVDPKLLVNDETGNIVEVTLTDGRKAYVKSGDPAKDARLKLVDEQGNPITLDDGNGYTIDQVPVDMIARDDSGNMLISQTEQPKVDTVDTTTDEVPAVPKVKVDKDGEPIYEESDIEATINDLRTSMGSDEEVAELVNDQISDLTEELAELTKAPKGKAKKHTSMNEKKKKKEAIKAAQKKLDYWNSVKEALNKPADVEQSTAEVEQPAAPQEPEQPKAKSAQQQIYEATINKNVGKKFEYTDNAGMRTEITIDGVDDNGKVIITRQDFDKQGNPVTKPTKQTFEASRIGKGIIEGAWKPAKTIGDRLREAFKDKKKLQALTDVLNEDEMQKVMEAYEKGDQEALNDIVYELEEKHREDLIMKDRDERNASVERILNGAGSREEKLRRIRLQYQGNRDAEEALSDESMQPTSFEEIIADMHSRVPKKGEGPIAYYSYTTPDGHEVVGMQSETGHGKKSGGDTKGYAPWLAPQGKGMSLTQYAENLRSQMPEAMQEQHDVQDVRNYVRDMFASAEKPSDIPLMILRRAVQNAEIAARREEDMAIDNPSYQKVSHDEKSFAGRLAKAKQTTNTEPTEAQKEKGNYKKGHVSFGGYDYVIENPEGSMRRGEADGKKWEQKMNNTYGYILGKYGKDGDHLDMFINDGQDLDNWNGKVYVVDQIDPKTGLFDEHKVMYGFNSEAEARDAYLSNYEKDWKGLGAITGVSKEAFDKWLDSSKRKLIRFADHSITKEALEKQANEPATDADIELAFRDKIMDIEKNSGVPLTTDMEEAMPILNRENGRDEQSAEETIKSHKVDDAEELKQLENQPTVKRYRAMQLIDGRLYPPMSAKVDGEMRQPTEIGVWEKAEERPDLVKNGKFVLNKAQKGQGNVPAAYNPYFHTSTSGLNDQFTSAYKRPELVVVEVEIPESELTSGYKAEGAKDAVGDVAWHSGVVNGQLPADRQRQVTLSRYSKVNRIIPDSEVAEMIAKQLEGTNVEVPYNVVTPSLRAELEKQGVKISDKPAGSVTEDANGNRIRQQKAEAPIFVSNALKAVEGIKQDKATPDQWLAMIQKNGGLKAGEDKWIGLSDWLTEQKKSGKSVTKQEVLDYIRQNQIQVEEERYANLEDYNISKDEVAGSNEYQALREDLIEYDENDYPYVNNEKFNKLRHEDNNFFNGFSIDYWGEDIDIDDPQSAALYLGLIDENTSKEIDDTRLNYTTDGLENKREIALTVPTIDPYNEHDRIHFGDAGGGRAVAWVRFGETTDKDGNKVLVVDEIQSKRHQDARKIGYDEKFTEEDIQRAKDEVRDFSNELFDKYIKGKHPGEDYLDYATPEEKAKFWELSEKANSMKYEKGVPQAPFEKNWHELAMKRILRYAAENGYDKVAWTTGDQQTDRYDIGVVDKIEPSPHIDPMTGETVKDQYDVFIKDKRGVYIHQEGLDGVLTKDEILQNFGKDLGTRIINEADAHPDGFAEISGDGLRIGSEGMKGFYDDMLPRFMNKYGKKWGVKVGETFMPKLTGKDLSDGMTMHSIDVTPEMKESVMEGQPMFFKTKDGYAYGFTYRGKIYIDPSIATSETPIHEYGHLWAEMKRQSAPEEWNHIKQTLLADKLVEPFIEKVKRDYPELTGEGKEDDFVEEVLTQFSGKHGAEKLRKMAQEIKKELGDDATAETIAEAAIRRVKSVLNEFWKSVCGMMGWKYTNAEEIADAVLRDLLNGVNPVEEARKAVEEGWDRDAHKQSQFDIISKANPFDENLANHTWIKSVDDVKTFDEALKEGYEPGENVTPDYTSDMVEKARRTGKVKVYSSHPIKNGTFVSPSKMEAKNYAGDGKVYSKEVSVEDVAWIDAFEGQYAKIDKKKKAIAKRDQEYADAVKAGDMEKVDAMLREEARKNGYTEDSDYQGTSAFNGTAPSSNKYYATREERAKAFEDGDFTGHASLGDYMEAGIDLGNLDWTLHDWRGFHTASTAGKESIMNLRRAVDGNKKTITMYRSVPSSVKENSFRNGDWITPSRLYAEENALIHGWGRKYRIIEQEVPVDDIWWDNNDINEWGYDDGKGYAYKNTKNNRKLLEPTYDEEGKLIPLSKRFDQKQDNIMYQLMGKKGAEEADRKDESTIRTDNNRIAEEMEKAGKDANTIKLATGWERGKDGKWRYEIPDATEVNILEIYNESKKDGTPVTLMDILGADNEIFKFYPELKDMPVKFDEQLAANVGGSYNKKDGIRLNAKDFGVFDNADLANEGVYGTLLHEIQHAIQDIEGFAQGGNLQSVVSDEGIKFVTDKIEAKRSRILQDLDADRHFLSDPEELELAAMLDNRTVEDEKKHLQESADKLQKEYDRLGRMIQTVKETKEVSEEDARDFYQHIAGEVESRNVTRRMDMSEEQRLSSLAADTEDVNRNEQVVMMDYPERESMSMDKDEIEKIKPFHDVIDEMFSNPDFNKSVHNRDRYYLGKTPDYMKKIGITGDDFYLSFKNIKTHQGKDQDHNLGPKEWHEIPSALKNPFLITKYGKDPGKFRLYTRVKVGDKYAVVGVDVIKTNQGKNKPMLEINRIKTVFGRDRYVLDNGEDIVAYNEEITPEQEALLRGHNFREYPSIQELSGGKDKKNIDSFQEKEEKSADEMPRFSKVSSPEPELTPEERQYWNKWNEAMKKWKEQNALPANAEAPGPETPKRPDETMMDYVLRITKERKQRALWQTAPKLEDYRRMRTDKDTLESAREEEQKYPDSPAAKMRRIAAEFQQIRSAMSRQKAYDKSTVKAVTDFAQNYMRMGFGDNLSRGDVERMLSSVKNAVGAKTVKNEIDNIMNILTDNYLRNLEQQVVKLSSIRELRKNVQGVEVQGKLELKGQRMIQAFRTAMEYRMSADEIREKLGEVAEKMGRNDEEAPMWEQEFEGLSIALQYAENVEASRKEWAELDRQYKEAVKEYDGRNRSYQAQQELLASIENAMMENKIERIGMYGDIIGRLQGNISESMKGAHEFIEREKERIKHIQQIANFDLAGKDMGAIRQPGKLSRIANSTAARFFLGPLATFEQMLKQFGGRSVNGEGYLYNHFMRKWMDATDNAFVNETKAKEELDEKAREVFGDKVKRWSDLYKLSNQPGMEVKVNDQGEDKTLTLTQGNMLYIYMANKMNDGKMKLRKMGITEEDVEAIKETLDPRLVQLGDWIQEDYLPKRRVEYNKVYERMFGAPMAAIENYFPIKVLGDARYQEKDVNTMDQDPALPSTITGNIIKRTKNALPLDILNTDAVSLALEHIEDMERWAAQAELNKDINTLLSYTTFRNKVKNMNTIYGSGDQLWNNFADTARMAAGTYRPKAKPGSVDKTISNIAKGVTAAKISFRMYTAFKQILSAPAFAHDVDLGYFVKNSVNPYGSWKWAMENMPVFQKRWKSRQVGDTRLMDDPTDWKMWKDNIVQMAARIGMSPNALVDGITCAVGARSIYESRLKKYTEMGLSEAEAEKRALQDAEIGYNLTQQSSEGAFVSAIQKDRTVAANMLSVFRNSSMAYTRQWVDAARNLSHMAQKGFKEDSIEFMTRQFQDQLGLDQEQAEEAAEKEYARAQRHELVKLLNMMFGVTVAWNLGAYLPYLLIGDDNDTKKEMMEDALLKGLTAGPTEGLAAGNIISELTGRALSEKTRKVFSEEGLGAAIDEAIKQSSDYEINPLPLFADIQGMIKKGKYDKLAAAQDLFNIIAQSGVGVNPQTFTDIINAAMDYGAPAWDGTKYSGPDADNLSRPKEIALFIMRLMNAPTSSWRNKYIDELGMNADEAQKLSYDEMAKRYAHYKHWKDAPVMGWLRSNEERQKKMETIRKQFDKAFAERVARLTNEGLAKTFDNTSDATERKKLGEEAAKRLDSKDTMATTDSEEGKVKKAVDIYARHRTSRDMVDDLMLESARRKALDVKNDLNQLEKRFKNENGSSEARKALNDFVKANEARLKRLDYIEDAIKKIKGMRDQLTGDEKADERWKELREYRDSVLREINRE